MSLSYEQLDHLQEFIVANLFDGDNEGTVQAPIKPFVQDLVGLVSEWLDEFHVAPQTTADAVGVLDEAVK